MGGKVDHSGHRERLKARFSKEGLSHFEPHNVLELLLFFSIPYKDTNEIAHRLLNQFGSIRNVLDAPEEELERVPGVGHNTAILLKLVTAVERRSRTEFNETVKAIDNTVTAKRFCENLFYGQTNEAMIVICLDNCNHLIHYETVANGTVNHSSVECRPLLEAVLRHNSSSVILTHNHPRGECTVSSADLNFTMEIKMLLRNFDIELRDHIVVGEWATLSMAEDKDLKAMF